MKVRTLAIISALFAICACNPGETDIYSKQLSGIEKYVNGQMKSDSQLQCVTRDGVFRLIREQGDGDTLERGDTLLFTYTGYRFSSYVISSANIFVTNDISVNWNVTDSTLIKNAPAVAILGHSELFKGLETGFDGIKCGEKCEILFPSRLGAGGKAIGTIPANCPLAYVIKVVEVRKKR